MLTSLDLLVIVFIVLAALTLLSLCLMFLLKNTVARRVFFYVLSVIGIYVSWIGFRIGYGGYFPIQMAVGVLTAASFVGAFVLERVFRKNGKVFLISRIASAVTLAVAFYNAVM